MNEGVVQLGKLLIIAGIVLAVIGLVVTGAGHARFLGLGRLPGDIVHKGKNTSFYFPIVTCLIVSAVLTLALWIISYLGRR